MIRVNGETCEGAGLRLAALLAAREIPTRMVAVEVNGAIVPRAEYDSFIVPEDAVIEVVRFVGGG